MASCTFKRMPPNARQAARGCHTGRGHAPAWHSGLVPGAGRPPLCGLDFGSAHQSHRPCFRQCFRDLLGLPHGEADDLAISPDGALALTAIVAGELRFKAHGGSVQVLASGLPAINPVTFGPAGQIYFGQLGPVNTLYEIHPKGDREARLITRETDQLNSFEVGADGRLYGPFWERGVLVAIDPKSGAIDRLATVPGTPSAI